MDSSRMRGLVCGGLMTFLMAGCLTEADGVDIEDFGERSEALCSATKLLARPAATSSPAVGSAEAAVDGNSATSWQAALPSTLLLDYKAVYLVNQLVLTWSRSPTRYQVDIGITAGSWTRLKLMENQAEKASQLTISDINKKARYIRVKVLGATQPPALAELQARGDTAANCLKADGAACSSVTECASERCGYWYKDDADNDQYGATPTPTKVCGKIAPSGYVSSSPDCCDTDAASNPQATTFMSQPNACGSWDYNCSGSEDKANPIVGSTSCNTVAHTCTWSSGYIHEVAECGQTGAYIFGCEWVDNLPGGPGCRVLVSTGESQTCY